MNLARDLVRDVRAIVTGAHRNDVLLLACVVLLGVLAAAVGLAGILDDRLLVRSMNAWFDADTPRVVANMLSRVSDQSRNYVHPLFPLATLPATKALLKAGLPEVTAVYAVFCAYAGVWSGLVFVLLRAIGTARLDAIVFWCLMQASAAAVFWTSMPETWLVGSVSILATLLLAATATRLAQLESWMVIGGVMSIGITVTNFMVAVAAMASLLPARRAIAVGVKALCAFIMLWWLEAIAIKTLGVPFRSVAMETGFISQPDIGSVLERMRAFFLYSMLLPAPEPTVFYWHAGLSVQRSMLSSVGLAHGVGLAGWCLLLLLGLRGAVRARAGSSFPAILLLAIAGQLSLHLVFGDETFLYSLHFIPLLVLLSSYSTRTGPRPVILGLTVVLAAYSLQSNVSRRTAAQGAVNAIMLASRPEREVLSDAMKEFPAVDWPRGEGHVVLGLPGAPPEWRAYLEPGGSFSPAFGTFGISILVRSEDGRSISSSNSIPLVGIRQVLSEELDGIGTTTPWYGAVWTALPGRRFRLALKHGTAVRSLAVRVSSAGPAGATVRHLRWQAPCVIVNDEWQVCLTTGVSAVSLGVETENVAWPSDSSAGQATRKFSDGFGAAVLVPERSDSIVLEVSPMHPAPASLASAMSPSKFMPVVSGIDSRIIEVMRAQLFHLRSSDGPFRPAEGQISEPSVLPFQRYRDGAYAVAALARIGDLKLAFDRARAIEGYDFGGPAGAEADAPGLAIWALDELRRYSGDSVQASRIWPHVERKARLIERMVQNPAPLYQTPDGPVDWSRRQQSVRELSLVSRGLHDGLVIARVDAQEMVVASGALSYLGLRRASAYAEALGMHAAATRFRTSANTLQARWIKAFRTAPDRGTPHALSTGLWPGAIAAPASASYRQLLETEGRNVRAVDLRPEFVVGLAQQWLRLGEPERAWTLVDSLLRRTGSQSSFALTEADPRVRAFGRWDSERGEVELTPWDRVRGGARSSTSGPLQGASALTMLAMLDMLASESEDADRRLHMIIGPGIRARWLQAPIRISGLRLPDGVLGWSWDGQVVSVDWTGPGGARFALGSSFPPGTRISVNSSR